MQNAPLKFLMAQLSMYTLDLVQIIQPLLTDPYHSQTLTVNLPIYCEQIHLMPFSNQFAVLIPDKEQEEKSITALWSDQPSDKFLYEAAAKFSNDE